ncbi:hypothetical protein QR46_3211 [Giardia duodenalis assemblage B]|uniref:Uncharacterized protein n=1 Tax=Giardia duodenalis assemblage B TaxID=1394984 RepID=A0A132NRY6_GIAIN|nr:hypothetical protein QR46_3211 [Giardia intestinalis assemblage B]
MCGRRAPGAAEAGPAPEDRGALARGSSTPWRSCFSKLCRFMLNPTSTHLTGRVEKSRGYSVLF